MVCGGGILGGARKIWGNPYLNSTTVLFDKTWYHSIPYELFYPIPPEQNL